MGVGDNQLDKGGDMSTPDARLSAAERAALANLEAAAAAEDPHLAARLKGSPASRLKALPPIVLSYLLGRWKALLRLGWWGGLIAVAGLGLIILGMSTGLVVAIVGAAICAAGLRILAQAIEDRRTKTAAP